MVLSVGDDGPEADEEFHGCSSPPAETAMLVWIQEERLAQTEDVLIDDDFTSAPSLSRIDPSLSTTSTQR